MKHAKEELSEEEFEAYYKELGKINSLECVEMRIENGLFVLDDIM